MSRELTKNDKGSLASNGKSPDLCAGAVPSALSASVASPGLVEGSRAEHDIIPRERTASGDVIPRRITYSHPISGGVDLQDMELAEFLNEIEGSNPLLAR